MRELFDMETKWLSSLSIEDMKALAGDDFSDRFKKSFKYFMGLYFNSGEIAMVLAGINPCVHSLHYALNVRQAESYYGSVLYPWFEKHKKKIRSEGFDVKWAHCWSTDGEGLTVHYRGSLVKNKRSPSLETIDKIFSRTPKTTFTAFLIQDIYSCDGTWDHPRDGAQGACKIFYNFAEPDFVMRSQGTKLSINRARCMERFGAPENSEKIGLHFSKTRAAMRKFGIELCLEIMPVERWSDSDIVKAWLAAANRDAKVLLEWLDKRDVPVIWTKDMAPTRLSRIKKLLIERA